MTDAAEGFDAYFGGAAGIALSTEVAAVADAQQREHALTDIRQRVGNRRRAEEQSPHTHRKRLLWVGGDRRAETV